MVSLYLISYACNVSRNLQYIESSFADIVELLSTLRFVYGRWKEGRVCTHFTIIRILYILWPSVLMANFSPVDHSTNGCTYGRLVMGRWFDGLKVEVEYMKYAGTWTAQNWLLVFMIIQ